jgi:alanine racemase
MNEKNKSLNNLYIDLSVIASNYVNIREVIGKNVQCAANIKANAYGLGSMPIMRCLSGAGCNKFFVTCLEEAVALRNSVSITDEIYVLNGIAPGEEADFVQNHITPVLNSKSQFEMFNNYCRKKNKNFSAVLNVDVGLNRIGIPAEEAIILAKQGYFKQKANLIFITSQLDYVNQTTRQLEMIKALQAEFNLPISLAGSKGISFGKDYYFDIVKLGIDLYKNSISLSSSIIQIQKMSQDISVGFDNPSKVSKDTMLAIVPIGYADGLHKGIAKEGFFYINDRPAKIMGDIHMELVTLDVTNIPEYDLAMGAEVEILGKNISVEQMAQWAGISAHNVLTSLGQRIKRNYI